MAPTRGSLLYVHLGAIAVLLCMNGLTAQGRIRIRPALKSAAGASLRRRLHVNSLITDPGTAELEWGNDVSETGDYFMPTTLKLTPSAKDGFWGRTELSANFDLVSSPNDGVNNATHFSDHLLFAATTIIGGNSKWNFALAPNVSFLLRNDRGARLGATMIARYDSGLKSLGFTLGWSGATASSPTNPAGTFDVGAGYGTRLASSGKLSRWSPYGNLVFERSSGGIQGLTLSEGVEYQLTQKFALQVSGQQINIGSSDSYQKVIAGITYNLGQPKQWWKY